MYCTKCGKEVKPGASFCTNCGTKIKGTPPLNQNEAPHKKKKPIIGIILAAATFLIILALGILAFLYFQGEIDFDSLFTHNETMALSNVMDTEASENDDFSEASVEASSEGISNESESGSDAVVSEENAGNTPSPDIHTSSTSETDGFLTETDEIAREYILPESDSKYLSKSDLQGFTSEQCRIARNEIYARHGRRFKDEELQSYFDSKSWYEGTIEPDNFAESTLNDFELSNRDLIVSYEKEMGYR